MLPIKLISLLYISYIFIGNILDYLTLSQLCKYIFINLFHNVALP